MTHIPADEILTIFDIAPGASPARAVVELSRRDLDEERHTAIYRALAGAEADVPARVGAVNAYILMDTVMGKELNIPFAIERAAALPGYNFSESARSEREAARAERSAKRAEKAAEKAEKAAVPYETVAEDGTITRKRGRPPAGTVPTYQKVKEFYIEATDRSKGTMLPLLQAKFGLTESSATVYWYRARKEVEIVA